jgi:hypothetical protein
VETEEKTTAVKGDVKINGRIIRAIIDTGAATSVITSALLEDLQEKVTKESEARLIGFDGSKKKSMGTSEVEIELGNWLIPTTVEVVKTDKRDLIIGTRSLAGMDANIDLKRKIMTLKVNDEDTIEIPIYFTRHEQIKIEISDKEESESDQDSDNSIEYEDIKSEDEDEQMYSVKIETSEN